MISHGKSKIPNKRTCVDVDDDMVQMIVPHANCSPNTTRIKTP